MSQAVCYQFGIRVRAKKSCWTSGRINDVYEIITLICPDTGRCVFVFFVVAWLSRYSIQNLRVTVVAITRIKDGTVHTHTFTVITLFILWIYEWIMCCVSSGQIFFIDILSFRCLNTEINFHSVQNRMTFKNKDVQRGSITNVGYCFVSYRETVLRVLIFVCVIAPRGSLLSKYYGYARFDSSSIASQGQVRCELLNENS